MDGARMHVIVQKPAVMRGGMDEQLTKALHQFLRPHFTESDCKLIMHHFDKVRRRKDMYEIALLGYDPAVGSLPSPYVLARASNQF